MQTQEARGLARLWWPAALDGVCGAIIASFVFIALGYLHPALALPLIGLAILGALARPVRLHHLGGSPPSKTADPSGETASST